MFWSQSVLILALPRMATSQNPSKNALSLYGPRGRRVNPMWPQCGSAVSNPQPPGANLGPRPTEPSLLKFHFFWAGACLWFLTGGPHHVCMAGPKCRGLCITTCSDLCVVPPMNIYMVVVVPIRKMSAIPIPHPWTCPAGACPWWCVYPYPITCVYVRPLHLNPQTPIMKACAWWGPCIGGT